MIPRLLSVLLLLSAAVVRAQDILTRQSGEDIMVKVVESTPSEVTYRRTDNPDGPLITVRKTDVFMIRYANGTKEVLRPTSAPAPRAALAGLNAAQRTQRGRSDSRQYYKPLPGVFWGTFAGTVTTGYGGLVVGTAIALTPPPRYNLQAPEPALLDDSAYYDGYRRQAKSRKLGKAAAGFGVGVGALATVGTLLFLVVFSVAAK